MIRDPSQREAVWKIDLDAKPKGGGRKGVNRKGRRSTLSQGSQSVGERDTRKRGNKSQVFDGKGGLAFDAEKKKAMFADREGLWSKEGLKPANSISARGGGGKTRPNGSLNR